LNPRPTPYQGAGAWVPVSRDRVATHLYSPRSRYEANPTTGVDATANASRFANGSARVRPAGAVSRGEVHSRPSPLLHHADTFQALERENEARARDPYLRWRDCSTCSGQPGTAFVTP
jgi:hypothetical protein